MHTKKWAVGANLLFAAVVLFVFKDTVLRWDTLNTAGGDGSKNIFTFLYHILYEKGLWFRGMNYPFGEHVLFTDNQPLLSVPLSYLNGIFHFSPQFLVRLLYVLIAFSFWLGMHFTYRLLRRLDVLPAIAIAASVCIQLFSPQLFRTMGHFGLAYASFLPMLFYWTVSYHESGKWKYVFLLAVVSIVHALLHMYFIAMALLWAAAYAFAYLLCAGGSFRQRLWHAARYLVFIVVAIGVVQVFLHLTDPVKDRPAIPMGSAVGKPFQHLCTSVVSPIWQGIGQIPGAPEIRQDYFEGSAYLGLALMIMVLAGLALWCVGKLRKRPLVETRFSVVWSVAAIITLLFAMEVADLWEAQGLRSLLLPLRQFRVPERLSWLFYYVMSIYAAVLLSALYCMFAARRKKWAGIALCAVILPVWALETNGNIIELSKQSHAWTNNYNEFFQTAGNTWRQSLDAAHHQPDDFQAILVMPLTHIGSEKLWLHETSWTMGQAFVASIDLQLPIIDVMMSRTSWSQSFATVKIASGLLSGKEIFRQMNSKPVLLLRHRDIALDPDERSLLLASDSLGICNGFALYSFSPQRYLQVRSSLLDSMRKVTEAMPVGDSVIGGGKDYAIRHFDEQLVREHFVGQGAFFPVKGKDSVVLSWTIPQGGSGAAYEFSVWSRFTSYDYQYGECVLIFKDEGGKEVARINVPGKYSTDNERGRWFRLNKFFSMPLQAVRLDVVVENSDQFCEAIDEILVRPADATVLSKFDDGTVLVNNHVLHQ